MSASSENIDGTGSVHQVEPEGRGLVDLTSAEINL